MKNYTTIIKPALTEKSSRQQEKGQYAFIVDRNATKIDIKNAIKAMYDADVKDVKTMILPKKVRMVARGRLLTKRDKTKKAIVTIKGAKAIDLNKLHEPKDNKK